MALTTVETGLMGIVDRWGYQVNACKYVGVGGTDVWTRVDGMANETAENRLKGTTATALDAAIEAMQLGEFAAAKAFTRLIQDYAHLDLGYATIDAMLTALCWRIPGQAADWIRKCDYEISVVNCGGFADAGASAPGVSLGNLTQGGAIASAADIGATYGVSPILARVTVKGADTWTLSVTCKNNAGASEVISQAVAGTGGGGAVGDVYILGAQALSGGAASGQKVLPVAATAQFAAAEYALVTQWSGSAPNEVWLEQELVLIASLIENTSVTATTNLLHTYTTDAYVYPLFRGVTAASGSGGNASDRVYFYPGADRRLKL